ncbi:putative enzyme [Paraburkholderia unamae]|uniref:HNH endonuclease n=1 Tax=Paraburkholderia unamae TaxID=219649 RepID=UPI001CB6448B|nr:HNH endonuclease [Paraburkholderia unamae]CAG9273454.1 putative enzyme [Paraburkholderia unamae]
MVIYRPKSELAGKRLFAHTIASFMLSQGIEHPEDLRKDSPMRADVLGFLLRKRTIDYWTANDWLRRSTVTGRFELTEKGLEKVRGRLEGKPKGQHVTTAEIASAKRIISGASENGALDEIEIDILQRLGLEDSLHRYPDEIEDTGDYIEGAVTNSVVNRFERNMRARDACIRHYGAVCFVCGFDFALRYGVLGEGFIHVHHLVPLTKIRKGYNVDPIADLRPVCPNCHAMLHVGEDVVSIADLKALLRDR